MVAYHQYQKLKAKSHPLKERYHINERKYRAEQDDLQGYIRICR